MTTSQINFLKTALKNSDPEPAMNTLTGSTSPDIFQIFIEQKLLINPPCFERLAVAFINAAQRLINEETLKQALYNYIEFVRFYLKATANLERKLRGLLKDLLDRSLLEMMTHLHVDMVMTSAALTEQFNKAQRKIGRNKHLAEVAEGSEWGFYELNGVINDKLFTSLRLLTFYTHWRRLPALDGFIGLTTEDEVRRFYESTRLANHYNSYDAALSKLTYGEWQVTSIELGELPTFTFGIVDESMELARQIGLKRQVSFRMMGRKYPFELQIQLHSVVVRTITFAFEYYEEVVKDLPKNLRQQVIKKSRKLLDGIDLADQLLVAHADTKEVFSQYIAATVLCTLQLVAEALTAHPVYKNFFITPELPLAMIEELLEDIVVDGQLCKPLIESFLSGPVIKNYFDLFSAPFIKDVDGRVLCLEMLCGSEPQQWVRQHFMKGGGIAVKVGKVWEDYLAATLANSFDCKVKSSVEIRQGGKTLTDIDVLAIRQNVLLVIQIKAYYGRGVNDFEQWKFREKLLHGAKQAIVGCEAIARDKQFLTRIFDQYDISQIDTVQPIVFTNDELFNSWAPRGVPVLDLGALNQLINGATVRFEDGRGKVKGKKHFLKNKKMSSAEFLKFLREPLDWQLSRHRERTYPFRREN